jgi:fructose-bisphosphate aldolase, class II
VRGQTAREKAANVADPSLVDPQRYVAAGRDAIAAEVARLLKVIGAVIVSRDERQAKG